MYTCIGNKIIIIKFKACGKLLMYNYIYVFKVVKPTISFSKRIIQGYVWMAV